MSIDKNILIKNIESNLYEIESILATPSINKLFKIHNINFENFHKIIALYISNINLLKIYTNDALLEILDKKLKYLVENGQSETRITLYYTELDNAITFIKNKKDTFFPKIKTTIQKTMIKEDIFTIDSIYIQNFFSIEDLKLENLKDKKEIYIVGENGDGKTLLLQAIAVALKGSQQDGQLAFREIKDTATLTLIDSNEQTYNGDEKQSYKNMLAYGANRNNNSLVKEDETGYLTLFDGSLDLKNPVDWLKYLDHSESKGEGNIVSVAQAKKLLNDLLNRDVEIKITATTVTFTEKDSEVLDFDRLSAGYKGVITIICDMLVRLSENQPFVTEIKDFQGVVLIDEVELHLHPKWEYNFMTKIREIFPNIQFIVTTHSPTVILGASKEAVFYKIYKDEGEVCISNQMKNEGYTNNSLISSPIFDLKTITSRDYDKKVSSDDYIYEKIHKIVSKRIDENINIDEEEILKLIDEELEKYDKS
ncbi:MAG: AAA family ATPase [Campylobacterota bacterium]|nr:AAA family ATPase [Campylobacterota bacterium]